MPLLAVVAAPDLPVVAVVLVFAVPPLLAPVAGVAVAAELPVATSVVFGDVTFVMKSKADDSPKYSPGKEE
jgi:hypothetical protein